MALNKVGDSDDMSAGHLESTMGAVKESYLGDGTGDAKAAKLVELMALWLGNLKVEKLEH